MPTVIAPKCTHIQKVCAWCQADLGRIAADSNLPNPISHGMCPACKEREISRFALERFNPAAKPG
ncbi:MAG: hypothetical protein WC881_07180 [Elusimicrobiota bacterium]